MDTVKFYMITFLFVLSSWLYSENKSAMNIFNYLTNDTTNVVSIEDSVACSKENAENIIRALPEVAEAQTRIQALTNNEKGISIMSDSRTIEGVYYYTFQVGFDGPDRFETYYFLLVNKANCSDVKIVDIISGKLTPINQWRKIVK